MREALYQAFAKDPQHPNCRKAMSSGYYLCSRPKDLPEDVNDELVGHSNKNNKGIQDTIPQRVMASLKVEAEFELHFQGLGLDKKSSPKGRLHIS